MKRDPEERAFLDNFDFFATTLKSKTHYNRNKQNIE